VDLDNLTYPDGYSKPEDSQVEVFKTWIWWNNEICNNCFTKIRSVGAEVTIKLGRDKSVIWKYEGEDEITLTTNAYYERTTDGIQAHTAFELPSDRFGQTFCKECGADTKSLGYDKDKTRLTQDAVNIVEYINGERNDVPYTVDGRKMGEVLKDFKSVTDNQGYDTEILAVAFCYAVSPIHD